MPVSLPGTKPYLNKKNNEVVQKPSAGVPLPREAHQPGSGIKLDHKPCLTRAFNPQRNHNPGTPGIPGYPVPSASANHFC